MTLDESIQRAVQLANEAASRLAMHGDYEGAALATAPIFALQDLRRRLAEAAKFAPGTKVKDKYGAEGVVSSLVAVNYDGDQPHCDDPKDLTIIP